MKKSQQFSTLLSGHDFQNKIFKGHNSLKNVGQVMDFNLCTSSNDAFIWFIFVQSFMKTFSTVLKLKSGHNSHRKNLEEA